MRTKRQAPLARTGAGAERLLHPGPVTRAIADQLWQWASVLEGLAAGWRDERWHELVDALRDASRQVREYAKRPRHATRFTETPAGLGEPLGIDPFAHLTAVGVEARRARPPRASLGALRARRKRAPAR